MSGVSGAGFSPASSIASQSSLGTTTTGTTTTGTTTTGTEPGTMHVTARRDADAPPGRGVLSPLNPVNAKLSRWERLVQALSRPSNEDLKTKVTTELVKSFPGSQRAPTISQRDEVQLSTLTLDQKRVEPDDDKPYFSRKRPQVDGMKAPPVRSVLSGGSLDADDKGGPESAPRRPLTDGQKWALSVSRPPPLEENHIRNQVSGHLPVPGLPKLVDEYADMKVTKLRHQGRVYDLPANSRLVDKLKVELGPLFLFPQNAGAAPIAASVIGDGLAGKIVFTRDQPPPGLALAGPMGPLVIPVDGGFLWEMDAGREPVFTGYDAWQVPAELPVNYCPRGDWLQLRSGEIPEKVLAKLDQQDPDRQVQQGVYWKQIAMAQLADTAKADLGEALRCQHAQAYGVDLETVGDNPCMLLESLQTRRFVAGSRTFMAPTKYTQDPVSSSVGQGIYIVRRDNVDNPIVGRGMIVQWIGRKNFLFASYRPTTSEERSGQLRLGNVWVQYFCSDDLRSLQTFPDKTSVEGQVLDPDFGILADVDGEQIFRVILAKFGARPPELNGVVKGLVERGETFDKRLREQIQAVQARGDSYDVGIHRVVCHEPCRLDGTQLKVKVFRSGELCDWLFHNSTAFEHVAPGTAILKDSAPEGVKAAYAKGGYIYEFTVPAQPAKAPTKK